MSSEKSTRSQSTFRVLPALAMVVGAILLSLGVLFLQSSFYGGTHIAAIGASVFLAGMVSTKWAANRWNMSPVDQRQWSMAFVVVAGLLTILFVIINYAGFDSEGTPITVE